MLIRINHMENLFGNSRLMGAHGTNIREPIHRCHICEGNVCNYHLTAEPTTDLHKERKTKNLRGKGRRRTAYYTAGVWRRTVGVLCGYSHFWHSKQNELLLSQPGGLVRPATRYRKEARTEHWREPQNVLCGYGETSHFYGTGVGGRRTTHGTME